MTQLRNIGRGNAAVEAGPDPGNDGGALRASHGADPATGTRPLTARSVLASTLLGTDPPWLPTLLLVRVSALFGLSEGTVRTAISRMAAAGDLVAEGDGYRLAGPLLERQARQLSSRASRPKRWTGSWEQAVVVADQRSAADRTALRKAMRQLKLAEWREGVWLRPANLDPERSADARTLADTQVSWLQVTPIDDAGALASQLWDLTVWAKEATALKERLIMLIPLLEQGDDQALAVLAEGFVVSAAALRQFLADPELPPPLLPPTWPGPELRAVYDRFDEAYRNVLLAFWSSLRTQS